MNAAAPNDDDLSDQQRHSHPVRFELIFGSLWLAFGLFLLPALIFWVGGAVLGPYGENASLGRFYGDFFGDLAEAAGRAWSIALGPLVLMYLLRAIFIGVKTDRVERETPPPAKQELKQAARRNTRVEPRVTQ